jgi:hypothetical protein
MVATHLCLETFFVECLQFAMMLQAFTLLEAVERECFAVSFALTEFKTCRDK